MFAGGFIVGGFDSARPGSFSCGWGHVASWLGVCVLVDLASDNGVGSVVSVVWGMYWGLAWLGCGCGVWYKGVSGKCSLAFWILFYVRSYVDCIISHWFILYAVFDIIGLFCVL